MCILYYTPSVVSFAGEPLQNSTLQPRRFVGDVPSVTGWPPSALPAVDYKAFDSPDSPGAQQSSPSPSHGDLAAGSVQFQWGNIETSQPLKAVALPAVSLNPSTPVLGTNPQIETIGKLTSDWHLVGANSAKPSLSPTPTRHQHPNPNPGTSLKSSGFSSLTASQLSLDPGQEFVSNHQPEEHTQAMMTSLPGHPLHSANLAFAESSTNQSYYPDVSPSSGHLVWNQPAQSVNTLPHQDEVLAPDYNVPFMLPHPISPTFEPTDVSPDDFYPTNTMEIDWGSGDYLETMTFLDSDGQDYSPVTKVLSDAYDLEDYTEIYDTAFPSRVGIFPSSLHPLRVSPSRSLRAHTTATPQETTHASPSPSPSSFSYTLKPTASSEIPPSSDVDWTDTYTIQPTDVLLPDMNSLEYYTTQLTRENNSAETGAEHRNASTVSVSLSEITSTSSFVNGTKFSEEGSSGEASGLGPQDESTTVSMKGERPQITNTSVASLDPSIVPTPVFNAPSSSWDGHVSTTDWLASALTPGVDSTLSPDLLLPTVTPLLPDSAVPYSSLTDVHWFVTESVRRGSISSTLVLASTTALLPSPAPPVTSAASGTTEATLQGSTTEQVFNASLLSTDPTFTVTTPNMLMDQGVTEDGADVPGTLTLTPPSSDANTVSETTVTATATNASHQTVTATAFTSVTNDIASSTSRKAATTATASRQYFCNVDRPVYLVKIGKNHTYDICYYDDYFTANVNVCVIAGRS